MTIFDNPFHILGASMRDNRRRIMALAEEKSLLLDADAVAQARNILTNPQKRLAAELRWFPGLSEDDIAQILDVCAALQAGERREEPDILSPSSLSALNIKVSLLPFRPIDDADEAKRVVLEIGGCFERLDIGELEGELNPDRNVAGFPPVANASETEDELRGYREDIRSAIALRLKALPQDRYIELCSAVLEGQMEAEKGYIGNAVVDDVLDDYGLTMASELESQKKRILDQASSISKEVYSPHFDEDVGKVLEWTKQWTTRARPLQLLARGRGQRHKDSEEIAFALRELAIELHNKHRKTTKALEIAQALKESFRELPDFAVRIGNDIQTLERLLREKEEEKREERETLSRNRMDVRYSVTLQTDKIMIPPFCTCCMKPTTRTERISTSASQQSGRRTTTRTVSLNMPLCPQCHEHRKKAKNRTRLLILISVAMAAASMPLCAALPFDSHYAFLIPPFIVAAITYALLGLIVKLPALDDEHSTMQQSVWLGGIGMSGNRTTYSFTNWRYAKLFMTANAKQGAGSDALSAEFAESPYRNRVKSRAHLQGIDRPVATCFQALMFTALVMVLLGSNLYAVGKETVAPFLATLARQSVGAAYTTPKATVKPTSRPTARPTSRPTAKPTATAVPTKPQVREALKALLDQTLAEIEKMEASLTDLNKSADFYKSKYQETNSTWYGDQYYEYIRKYNTLWEKYDQAIDGYNDMVKEYNALLD